MKEKIQALFDDLRYISAFYLIYRKRESLEEIREKLPQIQEFVLWFLEENRLGVETELYQEICNNMLQILKDLLEALEQDDAVLLHDAVAYGLMEYLKLFVVQRREEEADDCL